ncbi:MAG: NAD-dependent dehydratase [Nitrospinota bacterium]|nr:NAD-dependent dehydratase [Nitrospinota bacterium]
MKRKNCLVIGATSLVGKFLLPRMVGAGYSITAVSRRLHSHSGMIEDTLIKWVQMDISAAPFSSPDQAGIESVISLAPIWVTGAFAQNLPPSARRLVALSSTSVHTKAASSSAGERALAARLRDGENSVMESCARQGIEWTILRPTMIHGQGLDGNVTAIARFIARFGFFPVVGQGLGLRAPVHSGEVAHAALATLESENAWGKAYDISGGETLTYRMMVERVFEKLGKKPRIVRAPLWMARGGLRALSWLPPFSHLSPELADRMSMDMVFDLSPAKNDFGYNPGPFRPDMDATFQ